MRFRPIWALLPALWMLFGFAAHSPAAAPIDALQSRIDRAMDLLRDPELATAEARRLQYEALKAVLEGSFAFDVFSARTLGPHARMVEPAERERFESLFPEFLSVFYLRQLQERYDGETIRLDGQRFIGNGLAAVDATVNLDPLEVPVEIRMIRRGANDWRVYNVVVLGIDALSNYRTQMGAALLSIPLSEINRRLEEKIRAEQEGF